MMDRLLGKIGMPSYLPTPAEVLEGVQWLRENPALAASVVVGLTSYSMAQYYAYEDDSEDDSEDDEAHEREPPSLHGLSITDSQLELALGGARATPEEIARSVSAIQLGLLKVRSREQGDRPSAADSTASTQSSTGSGSGLRSRASSVFDRALLESAMDSESEAEEREKKPTCLHGGECPPERPCCDPDWGWFVSTAASRKALGATGEAAVAAAAATAADASNAP